MRIPEMGSIRGEGVKICAILCYLLALAGGGAFVVRVLLLGVGLSVDLVRLPPVWAWALDLAFLLLWTAQHSIMARVAFKARWTRIVPPSLERSVYAGISGLVLGILSLVWQPITDTVWWSGPWWLVVVPLVAALGLVLVNLRFDHTGLFGLRQAWNGDHPEPPEKLVVSGPYRFIRHPLMACLLLFLWTQPVMSPTLALLNGGMTLYIVIGLYFEERDLARRFHPDYAAYRRRVPALIPWRRPLPSA
jgi:protein-S-isoprenylcysteine O-methyltransferase Ste14